MRLELDLFYGPISLSSTVLSSKNTTSGIFSTRHKNYNNLLVMFAFQDLLQISSDIFQELDIDNMVFKIPVLVIENGVLKNKGKKNLINKYKIS